ncbi:MAG: hypothetical protein HYZ32_01025 [Hydrocarboniphaga effusa]|nr:hypothetical protein [Hydrocarboniphaga effusa]
MGGGGAVTSGGSLTVENSVIANNKAALQGGGLYLRDASNALVQHSQILSNSAGILGGGIYVENVPSTALFKLFNNLIVGNMAVDASAGLGGGLYFTGTITGSDTRVHSNTFAYNQAAAFSVSAAIAVGGGGYFNQTGNVDFIHNIFWFNDNTTVGGTFESGDNKAGAGTLSYSSNNIHLDTNFGGIDADPQFVQGFYLNQTSNPSVDGSTIYGASTAGLTAPFTTDPTGAGDTGVLDIGFHYQKASAGTASAATLSLRTTLCSTAEVDVNALFGSLKEAGHLVAVKVISGSSAASSLTSLQPQGAGSVLAVDRGDGSYSFTLSRNGAAMIEIYVDGALIDTVSFDPGFAC